MSKLILIIFILAHFYVFSQNDTVDSESFQFLFNTQSNISNDTSCDYDTVYITEKNIFGRMRLIKEIYSCRDFIQEIYLDSKKFEMEFIKNNERNLHTRAIGISRNDSTKMCGKLFFYYPDGSLKGKVKLRNSYAEGTMCYYYFNGCLANKIQYKKGLIDGNFTTYYSTGAVRIKGRYKANGRKGKWEEYYENGILMKSGYYCRDIKPIVVTAENYFDIIKSFPYLLDSHIYIGSIVDFKSGLWKYYSEDGTLQSEELYKDGLLIWDKKY